MKIKKTIFTQKTQRIRETTRKAERSVMMSVCDENVFLRRQKRLSCWLSKTEVILRENNKSREKEPG